MSKAISMGRSAGSARGRGPTNGRRHGAVITKPPLATRALHSLPFAPEQMERAGAWLIMAAAGFGLYLIADATGVVKMAGDATARAVAGAGFEVRKIEVRGARQIDRMAIYESALAQKNRSMVAVDLDAMRQSLMGNNWIKDVRVSRRLPDALVIDIVERTPNAVWQRHQKLTLVDGDGVPLGQATAKSAAELPLLIGDNANAQIAALGRVLNAAPNLRPALISATWVGNRRWDLRFQSGELLSLPEGEAQAMAAMADFVNLDGRSRLLGRGIVRFDMRDPAKFIVRLPDDGAVDEGSAAGAADSGADGAGDGAGDGGAAHAPGTTVGTAPSSAQQG